MSQSRQLAAIMFTDIVGYTSTMQKDERRAIDLVKQNLALQRPIIKNYQGQLLKEIGDGTMSSFPSSLDAVKCAIQIQQASSLNFEGSIRVGIHVGDITLEGDEIYGDGVNLASRIESIADPGGIYLSENVVKSIQGQKDFETVYVGERELKNVSEAQKVFAVQGFGLPVPKVPRPGFWYELGRRGVLRAGMVYILLAIFLLVAAYNLGFQDRINIILMLLLAGFPVALIAAWSFERAPGGFIWTTSVESIVNPYSKTSRKPFTGNGVVGLLVIGILVVTFLPRWMEEGTNQFDENSLAVLYFDNMSGDPEQEYFSDGITEEIISHLAKIEGLEVRSRTSVIRYKTQKEDMSITEIARELKVAAILEGSIRKSGDQVRITAQLINAATDQHLWSKDYNFEFKDIFNTQYAVAKAISEQFQLQISPVVETDILTPPTINMEAFDLYLQAAKIWNKGVGIGNTSPFQDKAKKLLLRAIQLDPEYADAYALLSKTYTHSYHQNPQPHILDSAETLGYTAVAFGPDNEAGYLALAHFYQLSERYDLAEKWLKNAIEIKPKEGLLELALLYAMTNRIPEALKYYYQYRDRYPEEFEGWRGILQIYFNLDMKDSAEAVLSRVYDNGFPEVEKLYLFVNYYIKLGQYDKVEEWYRNNVGDDTLQFNRGLAILSMKKGEWKEALEYFLKSSYKGMDLGLVYLKLDMRDSAGAIFDRHLGYIKAMEPNLNRHAYFDLGRIYLYHGDKQQGIQLIQSAFDKGWHSVQWLHTDPFFTELSGDPDVEELLAKVYRKNELFIKEIEKGW